MPPLEVARHGFNLQSDSLGKLGKLRPTGSYMYVHGTHFPLLLSPSPTSSPVIEQGPHANFDAVAGGAYELWPKRHEVGITYVK